MFNLNAPVREYYAFGPLSSTSKMLNLQTKEERRLYGNRVVAFNRELEAAGVQYERFVDEERAVAVSTSSKVYEAAKKHGLVLHVYKYSPL
ncbi:hypothetical protein [Ralstonia phage RP13]|nr:hypothetical protein [Ralstonia phage RP13]BCG50283.1 hypothetical protein [Ralstonia phage RP13]